MTSGTDYRGKRARGAGERVPTVGEVLDLRKERVRVRIELKYYGHDQRPEERVARIVEARGHGWGPRPFGRRRRHGAARSRATGRRSALAPGDAGRR